MKKELIKLVNELEEEDLENMLLNLYEFYFNFVAIGYKDFVYGQFGDRLKDVLKETIKKDGTGFKFLIETGTKGGASEFLFKEYTKDFSGYRIKQSEPIGSKSDRAVPFKNAILDGKIHIAVMNDNLRAELIKQLKSFPLGSTHDDIIDAIAYGYSELESSTSVVKTGGKSKRFSFDDPEFSKPRRRNRRTKNNGRIRL